MKKLSLASLIAGAMLFSACNGNSTKTTTDMDSASTTNTMSTDSNRMNNNSMSANADTSRNSTATTTIDDDTRDFAKEAATGGMMEVELGNLAMKNSSTQQVKDFGKMMVDDHTKINNQLKDLASVKNIDLPTMVTSDQQEDIDKLSKKTGADFDKAYVDMMIDDHKKDIDAFEKAGNKVTDNDLKTFITNTLSTFQKHLDAIQTIKKRM